MATVNHQQGHAQTAPDGKKILIAYFSWGGNTRNMAEQIKTATGADLFEIIPEQAYPTEYKAVVEQARTEVSQDVRPAIRGMAGNLDAYDIIVVGSPNWWGTIAPPVATFLSSHDFSGKTVLPFITHEGSRMGRSASDIRKLCPGAILLEGLAVRGGNVGNAGEEIEKWLRTSRITE